MAENKKSYGIKIDDGEDILCVEIPKDRLQKMIANSILQGVISSMAIENEVLPEGVNVVVKNHDIPECLLIT